MLAASRGELPAQAAPFVPRAAAAGSAAASGSAAAAAAEPPRAQTLLERWLSAGSPDELQAQAAPFAPPVVAADSAAASGSAGAAPHPTPPAASVADRPGANDSRPPPGRVAAEAGVSSEVRRLLMAQRQSHPRILSDLRACAPAEYRKRGHWAWWVFPTSKVGMCDPRGTAVFSAAEARWLLDTGDAAEWAAILDGLASALTARGGRDVLPRIDHDRVNYFLREWGADGHAEAAARHPPFAEALERFGTAWEDTR